MIRERGGSDRFIDGTIRTLPTIPAGLLNAEVIWQQAVVKGERIARENDNKFKLQREIGRITGELEPKFFALATKRFESGEYETVNKRKGEQWSSWTPSSQKGGLTLWFHAKDKEVIGADKLMVGTGGAGMVEVVLKEGKITEVTYQLLDQNALQKRIDAGIATESEIWMQEAILYGVQDEGQDNYQVLTDFTFVIDPPGLRVERGFYRKSRKESPVMLVETTELPKGKSTEWIFSAEHNRFAQEYEAHMSTREEYLEEGIRSAKGNREHEAIVREYAERGRFHTYPIVSPEEFTKGLELLLGTIPLEK